MYSARYNEGHLKICLTLIFKVNYGGQVTYFNHIEIPNIGYVQIDTNIKSGSRIQPMMNKVSQYVRNSDLDIQVHPLSSSEKF